MTIQQELEHALGEMRRKIQAGEAVSYTLQTAGWQQYIVPALQQFIQNISTVEGVKTLRELQGRQESVRIFKQFQKLLNSFIDEANGAVVEKEQIEAKSE